MAHAPQRGYLLIILHAHLPFVRHPEHPTFLEEDWLFEAITECYLPLLEVLDRLANDRIDFAITLSLSPTLLAMLRDPLLQERYIRRLDGLIELACRELRRTRRDPALHMLAHHYHATFCRSRNLFAGRYKRSLVGGFKAFVDSGHIELMTTCATHAYLPLMDNNQPAMRAQIKAGIDCSTASFGSPPAGFWLPECGYDDSVDEVLGQAGIRYFFLETHGLLHGTPRPRYGVFAPARCPCGAAAFARDLCASKQVWSAHEGYPGDYRYRDFYRDIGFDLDYDYIRPFLHGDGSRTYTGIKYYRITGAGGDKRPYDTCAAARAVCEHARHFVMSRQVQVQRLSGLMDRAPIVVVPFDAELLGHWWHEGPAWLEHTIRTAAASQSIRPAAPSEVLERYPDLQPLRPSPSSWGVRGFHEAWLNEKTDWMYPRLHTAARRMVELARRFPSARGRRRRALDQAARELMLAQSSDWAFIRTAGTMTGYATARFTAHLDNFYALDEALRSRRLQDAALQALEGASPVVPDLDYRLYLP
jgi:1,4-alpha-glucan branching enzyme